MSNPDSRSVDVAVIGGGAAGLSAALALGRSRRSVVVIDAGRPRNGPAAHMNGVLGHDGLSPGEFLALGRRDLEKYDVRVVEGSATGAVRSDDGTFEVTIGGHDTLRARRLVVATGLTDQLPEIPGLRERWGNDVIVCPYCHGWEVQDTRITTISTGPMGAHAALMFRQWSQHVTLVVHSGEEPTPAERTKLAARGVEMIVTAVSRIVTADDRISAVHLIDGRVIPTDTVTVGPRLVAHSPVLEALGLSTAPHPMGAAIGESYAASPTGQTDVPGVWIAGNVTELMPGTVPSSVAGGYLAGAHVNADLIDEETNAAVAAMS